MIRVAVTIVCATMFSAMCLAQNRPALRRAGPANPAIHGNLEGFKFVHKVWPTVKTNLPNGTRVTLTALVAHGKAVQASVGNGDADPKAAEALAGALRKWRFVMPPGRNVAGERHLNLAGAGWQVCQLGSGV